MDYTKLHTPNKCECIIQGKKCNSTFRVSYYPMIDTNLCFYCASKIAEGLENINDYTTNT